jgi:hypothetical protein
VTQPKPIKTAEETMCKESKMGLQKARHRMKGVSGNIAWHVA